MTPEIFIAGVGLIVAVAAAVFAERSSTASELSADSAARAAASAQHANDIALHTARLEIYKGLRKFYMALLGSGPEFSEEISEEFWGHTALSEFYFPADVYKLMTQAASYADNIKLAHDQWQYMLEENDPTAPQYRATVIAQGYLELKTRCKALDVVLREKLRLDRAADLQTVE